jgi:hypothetical protein
MLSLLSVSVVVNASQLRASSPSPLSSTVAQTVSFLRLVFTVTTIRPSLVAISPNFACTEWIELLMDSKSGCIAAATDVGFGSRSIRFTRLVRSDAIRGV